MNNKLNNLEGNPALQALKDKYVTKTVEDRLPWVFSACAFIAALSCFGRADYNLPLYAFLAVLYADNENVSY